MLDLMITLRRIVMFNILTEILLYEEGTLYMRKNNNEDKLLVFLYIDDLDFKGTNSLLFED